MEQQMVREKPERVASQFVAECDADPVCAYFA
jgi:hypothetical protein